ncbi:MULTISPECIES: hypothetical protein [Bacillus]|uniref:hypothetical protein n=1 Tax=Bacillus TaxID=1386 RepID=UPI001158EED3|nr:MULTISPECIES: hypothetical protein [Bacillus]
MPIEMKNFLIDIISEVQEKYNQTLISDSNKSLEDKHFRLGANYAYYDVLELIETQLNLFSFQLDEVPHIAPVLGEKINNKI